MFQMNFFLLIARILFVVVAVWGVYGFGGPTLVELLIFEFGFSLRCSAAIVSALFAILAIALLIPAMKSSSANKGQNERNVDSK